MRHDGAVRFFDGPDEVRRARQALDDAGYTLAAVTERLGPNVFAHLVRRRGRAARPRDARRRPARRARPAVPGRCAGARRGRASALAPLAIEAVGGGGRRGIDGDCRAAHRDPSARRSRRPARRPRPAGPSGTVAADHVLGVSASTAALAGATIRRPIDAAFDLGTGCGVQALYAAAHSARVVASDVNPRAVALRHADDGAQRPRPRRRAASATASTRSRASGSTSSSPTRRS